jgi:Fe-S cluster biogenesis protein NfuA
MLNSPVKRLLDEVLGPLVERDAGELHVVDHSTTLLTLHLAGSFAGCPGNTLAIRRVIEPIVRAHHPGVRLSITSGALVPNGAIRWTPLAAASVR